MNPNDITVMNNVTTVVLVIAVGCLVYVGSLFALNERRYRSDDRIWAYEVALAAYRTDYIVRAGLRHYMPGFSAGVTDLVHSEHELHRTMANLTRYDHRRMRP